MEEIMNTNFVNIIKRIAAEQGETILANPQRLKAFVSDYAKNEPKEDRLAFGRCIEAGAYNALKGTHSEPERRQIKAALLPQIQAASGQNAAVCQNALDVLEAVLFGMQSVSQQQVYQPAAYTPPAQQAPYQQPAVMPPNQPVNVYLYQQPNSAPAQQPYQIPPQTPPASNTRDMWIAVLILNIIGLNWVSRFITGHIGTGVLILALDIVGIVTTAFVVGWFLLIAGFVIYVIDIVNICTKKWQTKDGIYLVP
jgi:hypothetical protein